MVMVMPVQPIAADVLARGVLDEAPVSHAKPRATDLKANEWAAISHYFPDMTFRSKGRKHAVKTLLNASLFRFENRLPLRQLALAAPDYPPWATVHTFEEQLKRQGLWLVIIQKIGRTYLLPVIQKMMRFTPQVSRLSLGRVKILGRMVTPEVLRMAQADQYPYPKIGEPVVKEANPGWPDPTGETGETPPTEPDSQEPIPDLKPQSPPISVRYPGHVNLPMNLEAHRGQIGLMAAPRKDIVKDVLKRGLHGGFGFATFRSYPQDNWQGMSRNRNVFFVGDDDGNVTAHHQHTFADTPETRFLHMAPESAAHHANILHSQPDYEWPEGDARQRAESASESLLAAHAKAVAEGKLFAKADYGRIGGHPVKAFLKASFAGHPAYAGYEAYHQSPDLISADWLDEAGFSGPATGQRNRARKVYEAVKAMPTADYKNIGRVAKVAEKHADLFDMLAKHERIPEEDVRREAESPLWFRRAPWRLSHAATHVLGRRICLSPLRLSHGHYSKGCLHVNLPPDLAAQVLAFASQIPDDELHEEGRETCPHVTALYGFTDDKQGFKQADKLACEQAPVKGTLGKLAAFKKEDCDVLYVEVDSRDLARVNKVLKQKCRVASDYARYVPHATVAYLKPGASDKYVGLKDFDGKEFTCAYAVYSPAEGEDQLLAWCGKEGAEGEGAVRMAVEDEKTRDLGPPPAFEDRPTKQEAPHEPARRAGTSENLTPHVASPPPPPYTPTRKQREAMYGATPPTWAELSAADPAVMTVNRVGKNTYNDVRHVLMKDGRRYFWKNTDLAGKTGADFVRHERAGTMVAPHVESAVADTLRSLGFKDVPPHHVLRDHTGRAVGVLTPDVGGHSLADVYGGKSSYGRDHLQKVRAANRPEDVTRWLAASHMLNMDDRHNGNYHVGPDGEIIPLDFGFSLHPYRDDLVARKLDVPRSVTHQGKQRVVRWYGGPWATSHDALLGRGFVSPDAAVNPKDLGRFAIANRVLADRVAKTWESEGVPAEYVAKVHRELLERAKNAEAHAVNRSRLRLRDLPEKHRVSYGEPGISYQNMSAPDPDLWVHQWGNA